MYTPPCHLPQYSRFLNYRKVRHAKNSQLVSYTVRVPKWTMALLPGTGTRYAARVDPPVGSCLATVGREKNGQTVSRTRDFPDS